MWGLFLLDKVLKEGQHQGVVSSTAGSGSGHVVLDSRRKNDPSRMSRTSSASSGICATGIEKRGNDPGDQAFQNRLSLSASGHKNLAVPVSHRNSQCSCGRQDSHGKNRISIYGQELWHIPSDSQLVLVPGTLHCSVSLSTYPQSPPHCVESALTE